MSFLEQKEIEKKKMYKLYNEKSIKCSNMVMNLTQKKDKLDIIKRKNAYLKKLICKLMKENNIMK